MGREAYLVNYKCSGIARDEDFFQKLESNFSLDDGSIHISLDEWEDWVKLLSTEDKEKFKDGLEQVAKILQESEYDNVELSIG